MDLSFEEGFHHDVCRSVMNIVAKRRAIWKGVKNMNIKIKRIYEDPSPADGYRVLVDRLWPRGLRKAEAHIDKWMKELSPSDELRKWFGHDPDKWQEFRHRYIQELSEKMDEVSALFEQTHKQTITLLFAAKDTLHNNAIVLKEYMENHCPVLHK
jgi:uncharacterized protein YeaO (DUF488 family)